MEFCLDIHTHTLVSGHAYSTMNEMAKEASKKKLKLLGITEHAPRMLGSCSSIYFSNLRIVPREKYGVELFFGAELNILNYEGHVDLADSVLKDLDINIASMHIPCIKSGNKEENTRAYINVMKNPYIHVIGHPDDARYPIDYERLVEGAKKYQVLLEVNNASLAPTSFRGNPVERYYEMLERCKEYEQPILVGSDAHVDLDVGNHQYVKPVLEAVSFPEELVVNCSVEELKKYGNKHVR